MSTIAWLDTSADAQRRCHELLKLFTQTESRDELGIGQVRDTLSDLLFPGTSTIQTRARYFLFVPWCLRQKDGEGAEKRLVRALQEWSAPHPAEPRFTGIIGARAGANVKRLPSSVYWAGLLRWGIRQYDRPPSADISSARGLPEAEEYLHSGVSPWHATLPSPPAGFPRAVPGGFDLPREEAQWLRERITESTSGSLLAHLAAADHAPAANTPWHDSLCLSAPEGLQHQLKHARLFSEVMLGAGLLYNTLLAEAYRTAGFNAHEVGGYADAYKAWTGDNDALRHELTSWDQDGFWEMTRSSNSRIGYPTEAFVREWVGLVLSGAKTLLSPEAENLVRHREMGIKGRQSRFRNEKLLGLWGGRSGTGALDYRWPVVRRHLTDIQEGLNRA